MLLDAIRARATAKVPIPDTGDLREDLLTLVRAATANLTTVEVLAMVRVAVALAPHDDALATTSRTFWAERLAVDGEIVRRAVEPARSRPSTPSR